MCRRILKITHDELSDEQIADVFDAWDLDRSGSLTVDEIFTRVGSMAEDHAAAVAVQYVEICAPFPAAQATHPATRRAAILPSASTPPPPRRRARVDNETIKDLCEPSDAVLDVQRHVAKVGRRGERVAEASTWSQRSHRVATL
mgnify:CR=1 FL=1